MSANPYKAFVGEDSLFKNHYQGISIWYRPRLKPKLSVWGLKEDGIVHPKKALRRYNSTDSTAGTSIVRPREGCGCALNNTDWGTTHTAASCTSAHPPCLNQRAAANFISKFSGLQLRRKQKRTEEEKLQRWQDEEVQALLEMVTSEWTNGRTAAKRTRLDTVTSRTQAEKRCMKSWKILSKVKDYNSQTDRLLKHCTLQHQPDLTSFPRRLRCGGNTNTHILPGILLT